VRAGPWFRPDIVYDDSIRVTGCRSGGNDVSEARVEPGPAVGDRAAALSRLIGRVERHVSRRLEGVLAEDGLSLDQWRVLDVLADRRGHPMSEIAGHIMVPGPTLTKIVDRLVDTATVYRLVD